MSRTCSSCGAVTAAETRFCRHCGALLKAGATFGENETISPLAQTIPLSGEGHATSSFGTNDTGSTVSETKRVRSEEMEQLLRRSAMETVPDGGNIHESAADQNYVVPPTSTLAPAPPVFAHAVAPAPAAAAPRPVAPASRRQPRAWMWMTGLLLLVAFPAAVLAYYFLHRSSAPESANNAPAVANSNQPTEPVNANSSHAASGEVAAAPPEAPPEETPKPTPQPSASAPSSPREARARPEAARETEAPVVATASPPATTPPPAPVAQATPTPPPAAPTNTNGTTTAQADSEVFYFQAVNIVDGRDPRTISRAELLRALQLFQNVKSGPHAGEAKRQAERLGKELDRLRKRSQP